MHINIVKMSRSTKTNTMINTACNKSFIRTADYALLTVLIPCVHVSYVLRWLVIGKVWKF